MPKQIVVMTCIPGCIERGSHIRIGTEYAKYGQETWRWWCKQRGIEFVILDRPLGGEGFEKMPPNIQRWLAPSLLLDEFGKDAKVLMIDADTMIRWDAPNFLHLGGTQLAVARGKNIPWIIRSINAYQQFFPGVQLSPTNYFNSGVMVLGESQLRMLDRFAEFVKTYQQEMRVVQKSGNYGIDQTLLNFVVCREHEPVHFLSPIFNLLDCGLSRSTFNATPETFLRVLESSPNVFDFINRGYIWHFTALYQHRSSLMRETWRRVRRYYHGCDSLD